MASSSADSAPSASWKCQIMRAIVTQDLDKVTELVDSGIPQDFITVEFAEDCVYCSSDTDMIETTVINPSQSNAAEVLHDLDVMIASGRCLCGSTGPGVVHGVSVLHLACVYGPPSLVRTLVQDHNYDVNAKTMYMESTPLHMLTQSPLPKESILEIAEILLAAKADLHIQDKRHNLALHLALRALPELAAVLVQDFVRETESVETAEEGSPKPPDGTYCDIENDAGETPLLIAVKMADYDIVDKLTKAGANVSIRDRNDMLAINMAIHKDSMRMLKTLLSSPTADPSVVGMARTGLRSMCPLVYATCRENESAVELLLKAGAFVDCVDNEDSQPLLIAAYTDNIIIGKMLIDHGADVNLAPRQGYTALHHAAWEGHVDMCRLLLEAGSLHDTQTSDKNTPLALACHGDYLDTIRLLLAKGCNVNNQDKDQDAALHYCAYNGRYEGVRLLINYGANPDIENSYSVTPLWNAVFIGDSNSAQLLVQCNVRLSVPSRGIDQHAQTDHPTLIYDTARTPLYVACAKNHRNLVVMLLMAGVEIQDEGWFWGADFPPALRNEGVLLHWVTQQATMPRTLLRLCRNVIRKLLGLQPQKKVEKLELPTILKNFLLIKSFDMDL